MFLQAADTGIIQIGSALLTVGNTVMLLRLSFGAGRLVEKVDQLERRMADVESRDGCAAEDCALRHPHMTRAKG